AIKPSRMFFYDTEYTKQIKLGTRCMIEDVIETFLSLDPPASDAERSILPVWNDEEKTLLDVIFKEDDDNDKPDIDVDNWMKLLEDIAAGEEVAEQKKMLEDVIKKVESLGNQLERVMKILDKFEERVRALESFVKEAQKGSKKK
ncbi:hypothetical protein HID58_055305, partial [Brassica napus]